MKESKLFEIFPPEYRDLVLRYKTMLTNIFQEYQVVIFMARKAICFYKALVIGGHIDQPQGCEVFSNRVLTYDVLKKFQDKKVIVVDDVMIKGESLDTTLKVLSRNGLKTDVYIMARPNNNEKDILEQASLIGTYAELSKDDTYQISKHIADFITASVCPYNIDQPIYSFKNFNDEAINSFVSGHNLIDISSGLQRKYGIKSYVLDIPKAFFADSTLRDSVSLCKIRFLYGEHNDKTVFLAIPFVLFNEMKYTELEMAFSRLNNKQLQQFIYNKNQKTVFENQLKILQFVISSQLMDTFLNVCEIKNVHRLDSNDDFVFANNVLHMVNDTANLFDFTNNPVNIDVRYDYEFKQNEYLNLAFDFLYSDNMNHCNYCDAENNTIKSELLLLSKLEDYITSHINSEFNILIFSSIVDTLIDRGLIIPSIVHGVNSTIIRAYKYGEVYALNKRHFKLFAYALSEYLKGIGHDRLQKTEFEKLCVLFFREAIHKHILEYNESHGVEDEYSICYSKFGPRVSTSKPIYAADETSTLALKLYNLQHIHMDDIDVGVQQDEKSDAPGGASDITDKYENYKDITYYKVSPISKEDIDNHNWAEIANTFAEKFEIIYQYLFSEGDDDIIKFNEVRNMHMRTYIEFLIMISIGINKKEQLLSLLAEIYLFDSIDIHGTIQHILINYGRVLDGLVSGMWKYMCYTAQPAKSTQPIHPLTKLIEEMGKDKNSKSIVIFIKEFLGTNQDIDKNENIIPMIKEIGILIFSIVYNIWFMFKKYHIYYRVKKKNVDLEQKNKREFFHNNMRDLRKAIEDQVNSSTDQQNIETLLSLKASAQKIIERYNVEIASGKIHGKKVDNKSTGGDIIINGNVGHVTNFENGGVQFNGNPNKRERGACN